MGLYQDDPGVLNFKKITMASPKELRHFRTVGQYCAFNRQETRHPLIASLDLSLAAPRSLRPLRFEFYLVFLKEIKCGDLRYGCQEYDYEEGTLVFISPGQTIGSYGEEVYQPKGYALAVHPDFLFGSSLGGDRMGRYSFFGYSANEALHMSAKERALVATCFRQVGDELEQNIDQHSKRVLVSHFELLLNYCERFYDRQFITRQHVNRGVMAQFESLLAEYFQADKARERGLPSVAYFAERLHFSANYFGELVKKDTGQSPQEHIQFWVLHTAKQKLLDQGVTVAEVAYDLGFAHPHHFSRMFKKNTGMTPKAYQLRG